jgi:HEPN domain-containing protein
MLICGFMPREKASDWLRQAEAALLQARDSMEDGHHWASCFFAHQAAEYAAKALLASLGAEARGHSVKDLLEMAGRMGVDVPEDLRNMALNLDRHYLQSRYVNTFYSGAPVDYYRLEDAERAVGEAEELFRYCSSVVSHLG